jgi:hypothetical protein
MRAKNPNRNTKLHFIIHPFIHSFCWIILSNRFIMTNILIIYRMLRMYLAIWMRKYYSRYWFILFYDLRNIASVIKSPWVCHSMTVEADHNLRSLLPVLFQKLSLRSKYLFELNRWKSHCLNDEFPVSRIVLSLAIFKNPQFSPKSSTTVLYISILWSGAFCWLHVCNGSTNRSFRLTMCGVHF